MQTTKHKPNLQAQMNEHEMPEWKGKWQNYWIWKDCAHEGHNIYSTKIAAAKQASEQINSGLGWKCQDGKNRYIKDFITVIQIPISA